MELLARQQLETRIHEEIRTIFTNSRVSKGNRSYLQELSQSELLETLENELRFVGLYTYGDIEISVVVKSILEEYIEQWIQKFLSNEQQDVSESQIEIEASPFMHVSTNGPVGIQPKNSVQYINFLADI